jgi:hypothetical protein
MTTARTYGRTARWIGVPLAGAGLVALAACGTGTTANAAGAATGGAANATAASSDAFATCMAQNGVTLPERPTGGGAPGGAAPDGAGPGGGGVPPTGAPPAGAAGGGAAPAAGAAGGGAAPPGVDAATWKAAQQACASVAPTPPGAAGATATP